MTGNRRSLRPTKRDRRYRLYRLAGRLSWLHIASTAPLVTDTLGIVHAWRGNIEAHRRTMRGSWFGLVGAGVGASTMPDRLLPQLVVTSPVGRYRPCSSWSPRRLWWWGWPGSCPSRGPSYPAWRPRSSVTPGSLPGR